ncbi:MAG: tetratricopeptide repeat protein [Prevotella sp.]|nr:tetratricopeptide repeat protein [Prevotella sp.]
MKKLQIFMLIGAVALLATACSSKLGPLGSENFKVTPKPLETQGGHVQATINGTFPEKYMNKKAVVKVIPELRFQVDGRQQVEQGVGSTFQGEKVMGNNRTISYNLGGHYTMKSDFLYRPEMLQSEMWLTFQARVGDKLVDIPAVKVADGVIATSELYRKTLTTMKPVLAADSFQRITQIRQEANIKFLVAQTQLRKSELTNNSVTEFVQLLQRINYERETMMLNNIEVSGFASPEGRFTMNDRLASGRQNVSEGYVRQQLKFSSLDAPVDVRYTAEDWEGFQELVRASDIQDKDVILRVLSMYDDPEEREQQIRNMSEAFQELSDGILPELRRARLIANYEVIGRNDDQIREQFKANPAELNVEELLYAATLTEDANEQLRIYESAVKLYAADARAYNNIGRIYYMQGNFDRARKYFQQALSVDNKLDEANANLGLLELMNGRVTEAEDYIGRASGSPDIAEVLGNLHLAQGNYVLAEQDFDRVISNSAALAQILNKNFAKAEQTLGRIKPADGITDYLRAVLYARKGNNGVAGTFLRSALSKDSSLKDYAERDLELKKVQ